jgi:protocatechuate 3,4-dioxygenase beta subunit
MNRIRRNLLLGVGAWVAGAGAASAQTVAATEFQVLGPFYPIQRGGEHDFDLTQLRGHSARALGDVLEISGRVLNSRGEPVSGARMEVWQANAAGRYDHPSDLNPAPLDPNFQGLARLRTNRDGFYRIVTVKPGAYPIPGGEVRTPHVHFEISGHADRLATQMYFPGEPLNATDGLASQSSDGLRSLLARANGVTETGVTALTWDVVLPTG